MALHRGDAGGQRLGCEVGIERDVVAIFQRPADLAQAKFGGLAWPNGSAARRCGMLEAAKPFLRRRRGNDAVLKYRGSRVMPDAVERKEIQRNVFRILTERGNAAEDRRMTSEVNQAGFQLPLRIAVPALPLMPCAA